MGKSFSEKFKGAFKPKWLGITTSIVAICALLGAGYGGGKFLSELNCSQQLLDKTEEYQTKIFEHQQTCNYSKIEEMEQKTRSIELSVEQIKKIQNDK